jgi:glycosyltransferase involved in cell wall biosynthesis
MRKEKIRVLYEISLLGQSLYYPVLKSGIFRVTEQMARGLIQSDECELNYCASGNAYNWCLASEYLRLNPRIRTAGGLCESKSFKIARRFYWDWLKRKPKANSPELKGILDIFDNYLIDPKILAKSEIFYTGFYRPPPQQVRKAKHLKKFLFVHDLIPILYPDFFDVKSISMLMYILAKVDPDSWFLCNSQNTKKDLCNYLPQLDSSRVFVVRLGASDAFYPCHDPAKNKYVRAKYNLSDGPYIISVCTLEPRKNLAHLIRCFKDLIQQEHIEDLRLVLTGIKGWGYGEIFEEINSAPKSRIIVTGYVDDADLASLYSGALAFVYPSFYEGFGLPALEAMQCGIPVITSNTSSFPEVVGDAGIMLDPTDSGALCQGILKLYRNSSVRESMSQKGIERAKMFGWEKCAQDVISAYRIALRK